MSRSCFGLLLNYRDAARSIQCIRSLLCEHMELVVVWDNSADGGVSADRVRTEFLHDERVVVHVSPVNLGFAAGVNRALQICAERDPKAWILLINNDAKLLPGGLELLLAALEHAPAARLAVPDINHAGRILGLAYCHRLTGLLSWKPRPGWFSYASGCCMLVAPDRLGYPLFDEDFFMYGEDWELGWRLRRYPGSIEHVGQTLVEHEGSMSSGLGSPFYENAMVAAHLILVRKLASSRWRRWQLYAARGTMLLSRALVRSLRFRSLVPLKALWHGRRMARTKLCHSGGDG